MAHSLKRGGGPRVEKRRGVKPDCHGLRKNLVGEKRAPGNGHEKKEKSATHVVYLTLRGASAEEKKGAQAASDQPRWGEDKNSENKKKRKGRGALTPERKRGCLPTRFLARRGREGAFQIKSEER